MSKITDRLKELEERRQNVITEAMKKTQNGNGADPVDANVSVKKPDGNCSLPVFSLFSLMVITMVVVVVFSLRTIDKVAKMDNIGNELAALLEEQKEELIKVSAHLNAVELEFRGAFKKDREEAAQIQKALAEKDAGLAADLAKQSDEIRNEVLKYKSAVTDNESAMSQIDRDYKELTTQFKQVQEEVKSLREKVMGVKE
jgi:cysteinyl-tRNA synthetase